MIHLSKMIDSTGRNAQRTVPPSIGTHFIPLISVPSCTVSATPAPTLSSCSEEEGGRGEREREEREKRERERERERERRERKRERTGLQ